MTDQPTSITQELADLVGELLAIAAMYDGVHYAAACEQMALALKNGGTSRADLCNAAAALAVHLHRDRAPMMFAGRRLSETDRRANVTGRLLAVVSNYGGQRLVADNPAMHAMAEELADEAEQLAGDKLLRREATP